MPSTTFTSVSVPLASSTVFLDFGHGVGDQFADVVVVVGRNGTDLLDLRVVVTHFLALFLEVSHDSLDGFVDTAFEVHRIGAGGDILQTYVDDALGEDRSGGRTVTGLVVGLGSHFLDHLGTHVLEAVFQFDLLGHRDTVLGHLRGAEFLVDDDIAAFRAEGHLHCVCQCVGTFLHQVPGINIEFDLFCHNRILLSYLSTATTSL